MLRCSAARSAPEDEDEAAGTDGLAAAGHQNDLALTIGDGHADEAVVVGQVDGDDAGGARP